MPVAEKVEAARGEIALKLFELFRAGGFEGVSLADIAKATGLGRSSLYHYFPGGKEEMAAAVLDQVQAWAESHLLQPLRAQGSRTERIDRLIEGLNALYAGGEKPCIVPSMLQGTAPKDLTDGVAAVVTGLIEALTDALTASGAAPQPARQAALDAVIRIQGALIVSRAVGTGQPFQMTLDRLRADLLAV